MSGYAILALVLKLIGPCDLVGKENLGIARAGYKCGKVIIHQFNDKYQYSVDIYGLEGRLREELEAALKKDYCKKNVKCEFGKLVRIKEELK